MHALLFGFFAGLAISIALAAVGISSFSVEIAIAAVATVPFALHILKEGDGNG